MEVQVTLQVGDGGVAGVPVHGLLRVAVVEDQPLFRSMLELTLGAVEGLDVVAAVGTVTEANRLLMPIDHVTGWLFRVARNRITDLFRRKTPESFEEGVEDLHQLDEASYADVTAAIRRVSRFIADHFQPEKLNVASIGNQVRQMHVHLVGRSPADPAWPGTVWAFEGKQPYEPGRVEEIRSAAAQAFGWERSV